ncbi:MAG TPA: hypothetical protein PLO50_15275, partial [Nitrospira sp.]|nr:hypothetical protein [Nitrospira sp.]
SRVMISPSCVIVFCYGLMAWSLSSATAIAQTGQVIPQPAAEGKGTVVAVPDGRLQATFEVVERLYKIEALGFKALDETGVDSAGSDEVMVGTSDAKGFTHSLEIGNIDSGDTHIFDPAKSCMLPVRPGEAVLGESSLCDDIGAPAPLKVQIQLWEQDFDGFRVCKSSLPPRTNHYALGDCLVGLSDDFIGRTQLDFSGQQLEALLPNVGDEHVETVKLNPCNGPNVCDVTNGPDYSFTIRITRLADGVPRPDGWFVSTDGNGNISTIKSHKDWDLNWDLIVPGEFGGDSHTDLLLYSRSTGVGLFVTTDGSGNIATIRQHTDWDKTWDLIIPGQFGGDGHTDLVLYKRSTGEGLFVTTDGSGNIATINQHTDWYKSWDMIIPGDYGGAGHVDLLFYDASEFSGEFRVQI